MKLNKKIYMILIAVLIPLLLSGCAVQAQSGDQGGFFQTYFVEPFVSLIHVIANFFNGSYGLSIILITLMIRLLLMPLMLRQYKTQQSMKEKMELMKPEMDAIQKKLKETKNQAEQQKLQQEMIGLYKKYNVNPLSMGCLPILLQMPILMGFYYAIISSKEIASHSFMWFSLGAPDILITAIAGLVYYIQFKVSMSNMPSANQQQMKFMGLLSPIMIVFISFNAPAALPLYWTVGGIFLILQTWIGKRLYTSVPAPATEVKPDKA